MNEGYRIGITSIERAEQLALDAGAIRSAYSLDPTRFRHPSPPKTTEEAIFAHHFFNEAGLEVLMWIPHLKAVQSFDPPRAWPADVAREALREHRSLFSPVAAKPLLREVSRHDPSAPAP